MDQIKKPEVYIRADGNAKIGLGHIHRTLALADCLKDHFQITFCVYGADELVSGIIKNKGYALKNIISADYNDPGIFTGVISKEAVIVIDGYDFKTDYQKALKESGHKVIAIDDLNEWENVADAVINHGYSGKEYKIAKGSKLYSV
jgi:UDP-2,4-diacetamido-2,4,6-trideoxy-beta-L-altropyranose hydrolase